MFIEFTINDSVGQYHPRSVHDDSADSKRQEQGYQDNRWGDEGRR